MQLKRVVLDGFKSFANRVEFRFHEPITAIVGPNGSGKSNIVDAIRWAIGEQSPRALRGSRMTDIIFSGTDNVQGCQKALVILELVGEEFSGKITIKRVMEKDGKGKYFLDNRSCRLKDIKDLFMDSGVGSNGYALVGQGEVERILTSSPLERRRIFDEVAGIFKVRVHKEEALIGLEETSRDLQRVQDILKELKKREGPLSMEAQKAKEYSLLKKSLEEKEVQILRYQIYQELEKSQSLSEDLQKLKEDMNEKRKELEMIGRTVSDLRDDLENKGDLLAKAQDDSMMLKTRIQELKNLLSLNKEKKKNLLAEEERMKKYNRSLEDQKEGLEEKEKRLVLKRDELSAKLVEKEASLKEKEEVLSSYRDQKSAFDDEIQRLEGLHFQGRQEHLIQEKNQEHLEKEYLEHQEKRSSLNQRLEKEREEYQTLQEQIREKKRDLLYLQNEHQESLVELGVQNQEKGLLIEAYQQKIQKVQELSQKMEGLSSRLTLLKEMEADYQGISPGVVALLKEKEKRRPPGQGIIGILAHLIDFHPSLKEAMQAALGSRSQNVVVKREEEAKLAIHYLHKHSLGRVTFLPLETITVYSFQGREEERMKMSGIVGPLIKEITFPHEVARAIYHVLGRVVLALELKDATLLARQFSYRLKIVTLKGDLLLPGGAITGGTFQEKKGIIQRKGEIEELKKTLEEEKKKREENLRVKEEFQEKLKLLEEELGKKQTLHHERDLRLISGKEELLYLEKEEEQLKEKIQEILSEHNTYSQRITILQEELDSLVKKISHHEDTGDYEKKIKDLKEDLASLKEKEEKISLVITDMKVQLATWKQELEGNQREELKGKKEKRDLLHKKEEADRELKKNHEFQKSLEKRDATLREDEYEYGGQLQKLEDEKTLYQQKLKEEKTQLKEKEDLLESLRRAKDELALKEHELQVKETRSKVYLENLEERLTEYSSFEIIEEIPKIKDLKREKSQVRDLKRKLDELGAVNPGSVEEYQELTERISFLTEQSQDLKEAKDAMEKVIKEIELGMKDRFLSIFHQINEAFQEVFSRLFQGGSARLFLSDINDPLESGVEIMAQPPGKKLQNLSLMSGGEKALTAIALIFSLLKVQPSPFYILDEIDASLDEANLERFASFMSLFSQTQFIVITHRRRTMAMADTLYGLTMGQEAVSQIVSVNLKEREDRVV